MTSVRLRARRSRRALPVAGWREDGEAGWDPATDAARPVVVSNDSKIAKCAVRRERGPAETPTAFVLMRILLNSC